MTLLSLAAFFMLQTPAPTLWWEAEDAARTNFPSSNPFAPANATEASILSGGKWIGVEGQRDQVLFAEYQVNAPEADTYQFYARKFWEHGPFRYRVGTGPWVEVRKTALLDDSRMRQFVVANWVHAGEATLAKGPNTIRLELLAKDGAAAFDAFVLTKGYFQPRGKFKPQEPYPAAPAGWTNFDPPVDRFGPSAIDLRYLNEKFAGEHGFVRVRDGRFVFEKANEPVRFWAINTGHSALDLDDLAMAMFARSLAKQGVNMIRLHGGAWGDDLATIPKDRVNRIARFVAAMKKEGIYTCLSIYFPLWMQPNGGAAFAGFKGDRHPFATIFFNPEFQKLYRGWWTQLLTTPTSSGVALKDDPAIALVELVNEDSTMFWTFAPYENVPAEQMQILERQFGTWLTKKYGSLPKAFAAWGGNPVRGDSAPNGRAGFIELWRVFSEKTARGKDTAQFLTDIQRNFYQSSVDLLKDQIGFKGSIYASNWITADARVLGPLDKWSNTVADAMDRHGYYNPPHQGPAASYAISPGDRYVDRSALQFLPNKEGDPLDFSLPIFDIRYNDKPSMITEVNWTPPNRMRADFPVVAAAYGALQGSDAIFFFASDAPTWESSLNKFGIRTPVVAGQFPATALIFRQGLVTPGPVVANVFIPTSALFNLEGSPVIAPQNLDELRKADIPSGKSGTVAQVRSIDPLAFLVGKVQMNLGMTGNASEMNLTNFIDNKERVVTSATRELTWDYGAGRVAINAPKAQGATGFLKGWKLSTRDLDFSVDAEYGSVLVVALDDSPLNTSRKMLLQVMSEEKPTGWETTGTGMKTITSIGTAPLMVRNLAGSVTFKGQPTLKVSLLDANGYPVRTVSSNGAIQLQPGTFTYLIER